MDTRGAERLPFLCYPGRRATQRFSARCEPVSDLPLFGSLPANSQTLPRATAWPCTSMGGSGAQVKNVLGSTSTSERGLLSYPQISWHRIHAPSLCCPGEVMRPTRRNEYSWGTLEGQTSGDRYTTNASGKFGAAADCLNDFQLERTTQTACVHEAGHLCNDSFIVLQPDCTAIARRVVETTAGGKFRPVGPGAHRITAILILLLPACQATQGQDWPQFLGPGRDGVYAGQLPAAWPKPGIEVLWKVDVGQGFSAPVVARGRVILFHRRDKQAIVESLDEDTGKRIWSAAYPTDYRDDFGFDEGPRAAPAVAGERIFTFGAEGVLQALDFSTGKRIWSVDTRQKFGAAKGFFGAVCSPLVDDGRVLMNIGGPNGAGIGAFDAATGKVLWTATNDEAGYSAPVVATIGGARHALFWTRAGLVDVDPATGVPVPPALAQPRFGERGDAAGGWRPGVSFRQLWDRRNIAASRRRVGEAALGFRRCAVEPLCQQRVPRWLRVRLSWPPGNGPELAGDRSENREGAVGVRPLRRGHGHAGRRQAFVNAGRRRTDRGAGDSQGVPADFTRPTVARDGAVVSGAGQWETLCAE